MDPAIRRKPSLPNLTMPQASLRVSSLGSHRKLKKAVDSSEDMANKNGSASNFADQTDDTMISAADTINNFKRLNSGRKRKDVDESEDEYIPNKKETPTKKTKGNIPTSPIAVKTPRASKTSQTPQTGRVTSSIKFKGQPSNGREVGRQLVFWTESVKDVLLLMIQYHMAQEGITIPWDEVAHAMFPEKGTSGQAIIQQLSKMRKRIWERGGFAPPLPGRATDKKNKEKGEKSNIRGYVGVKGRGVPGRQVAWNEDCSMMYEDKDIETRRRRKLGPVTIEGMPNKRIGSDDAAGPDLDPEYTSDLDAGSDGAPVSKKKAAIRRSRGRKAIVDHDDTDDFGDGEEDFEMFETPTKKRVHPKKTPIARAKGRKSVVQATSSPGVTSDPEVGDNIMTFDDEDDMSYASDGDHVGSENDVDVGEKKLIIKMILSPLQLEKISKKNKEPSCENFPANYHLDRETKMNVTQVASGGKAYASSFKQNFQQDVQSKPGGLQSQHGIDEESQALEHFDAQLADAMYPKAVNQNSDSTNQFARDRFHVDEDGNAFDQAGNQYRTIHDNAGNPYILNEDGYLIDKAGIQYFIDLSGNLMRATNDTAFGFNSLLQSLNQTDGAGNTTSYKGAMSHGNVDFMADQPGNEVDLFHNDDDLMGSVGGDITGESNFENSFELMGSIGGDVTGESNLENSFAQKQLHLQDTAQQPKKHAPPGKAVKNWYNENHELISPADVMHAIDGEPILGGDIEYDANGEVWFQYKHSPSGEICWGYKLEL